MLSSCHFLCGMWYWIWRENNEQRFFTSNYYLSKASIQLEKSNRLLDCSQSTTRIRSDTVRIHGLLCVFGFCKFDICIFIQKRYKWSFKWDWSRYKIEKVAIKSDGTTDWAYSIHTVETVKFISLDYYLNLLGQEEARNFLNAFFSQNGQFSFRNLSNYIGCSLFGLYRSNLPCNANDSTWYRVCSIVDA